MRSMLKRFVSFRPPLPCLPVQGFDRQPESTGVVDSFAGRVATIPLSYPSTGASQPSSRPVGARGGRSACGAREPDRHDRAVVRRVDVDRSAALADEAPDDREGKRPLLVLG